MRRVVVTGLGLLTPLGQGVDVSWKNILAGNSGANRISAFDPTEYACQVACEVPRVDGRGGGGPDVEGAFNPDLTMSPRDQKRVDDFILYGIAAADEAVKDSGWVPETEEDRYRTGVIMGSGIGGLSTIADTALELEAKGPRRISPFFISSALINLISVQVSIRYGFKGPNHSVVTACATGAHAIGDATRLIKYGDADVMVAGGAEAAVCKVGMAGFIACRAVSTDWNDTPEKASRPYDAGRDGFVMGEGAGALVLETLSFAKRRGARIRAELIGYANFGDSYHTTAPEPGGRGEILCMRKALERAGLTPGDVDYINAHGTSTPLGDRVETMAIKAVFGSRAVQIPVSSTKGATGHLMGAGGVTELIACGKAIEEGIVPPTINYEEPDPDCDLDYVPNQPRRVKVKVAMSNSFGFGGQNSCLVIREFR
ncbi:MAG: beta-ketoacyl-ACP synthase II [Firmicutes bacterium]|nr:beta-ketoacyl-ACP synthase II [Bacillota bacterium]